MPATKRLRPLPAMGKPWRELTDSQRCQVLDWIVDACLLFGCQRTTAYAVASEFARGLDPDPPRRMFVGLLPPLNLPPPFGQARPGGGP